MTFGISFYVAPYITKNVGMETYGLVGLANIFTSNITIVTGELNSMTNRFVIIQLHKNNTEKANSYFNSAMFSNIIFASVSMLGCVLIVPNLDKVLNISTELVQDATIDYYKIEHLLSRIYEMVFCERKEIEEYLINLKCE